MKNKKPVWQISVIALSNSFLGGRRVKSGISLITQRKIIRSIIIKTFIIMDLKIKTSIIIMTFKEDSLPTGHLIFLRHFSLMLVGCQISHGMKSTTTFDTPRRFTKEFWAAINPYINTRFSLLYVLLMFTFSTWIRRIHIPSNFLYHQVNSNGKTEPLRCFG